MPRPASANGSRRREALKPLLVFFSARRSGPARRMESLLAHLATKQRDRLRIASVDIEESPETAERFRVRDVPTLVLVDGERTVARFEGRAKGRELEAFVERHLAGGGSAGDG